MARKTPNILEGGPDRGIQPLEPEVGSDEPIASVNANGDADERAIDIDDVGLQHRECLSDVDEKSGSPLSRSRLSYIARASDPGAPAWP